TPTGTFAKFIADDPRVVATIPIEHMAFELVNFSGPGDFSLYEYGSTIKVWMDTADGINSASDADSGGNPTDAFWAFPGTHAHANWAFTAPGRYELGIRTVGWQDDGSGNLVRIESPVST